VYSHGNDSYETGYVALCNQNSGSYTVTAHSSVSGGIAIGAYVYSGSSITGKAPECTIQNYAVAVAGNNNNGWCYWPGGTMNISSGGGNSGYDVIWVKGPVSYSTSNTNWCPGLDTRISAPAGWYYLSIHTGGGGGSCGPGILQIN
jgi:hypothetical protein